MLAVGALYTPQAAGTAALIVPAENRGSTIAYIFLGWSLAAAIGLPLITFVASRYGWRAAYGGIGVIGILSFLLAGWRLPGGLFGRAGGSQDLDGVGHNRMIVLLLSITTLQMSGQFVFSPSWGRCDETDACRSGRGGLVFMLYGVVGHDRRAIATRIVDFLGPL